MRVQVLHLYRHFIMLSLRNDSDYLSNNNQSLSRSVAGGFTASIEDSIEWNLLSKDTVLPVTAAVRHMGSWKYCFAPKKIPAFAGMTGLSKCQWGQHTYLTSAELSLAR